MTKEQERIFKGLNEIGETLANFYSDAITIMQPDCLIKSKANFIAHMAREIDGGLRDVLGSVDLKNEKLKLFKKNDKKGHLVEILVVVDKDDPNDELANEWFSIGKKFASIAHRQHIHGPSRDSKEIINLWYRYEQILLILIGSFYSLNQRLDRFMAMSQAPTESMLALGNILKNEKQRAYFFSKLAQPGWLPGLITAGYFDIVNAPTFSGEPPVMNEWWELRYLLNIAKIKSSGKEEAIKTIIDSIITAYQEDKVQLHLFSVSIIVDIITELDVYNYSENENIFLNKVVANYTTGSPFFINKFLKKTTLKLISKNNNDDLLLLMNFVFGYSIYTESQNNIFGGKGNYPITNYKPKLEECDIRIFTDEFGTQIMKLIGDKSITLVANNLKKMEEIGNFELTNLGMSSIEDTDQTNFTNSWERSLSNFIRDYASFLHQSVLTEFLKLWILADNSILQRLAFHLIRLNYADQSTIWWDYINSSIKRPCIHEPYILLRETSDNYSANQMQLVLDWIEKITIINRYEGQTEENALLNRHYNVRKWLSALSANDHDAKTLLTIKKQEYDALNNWEIDHPEYDSYSKFSSGPDMPIELTEFINLDIDQQVSFIQKYEPTGPFYSGDEGISLLLRQNVANNPEKYLFNLDKFLPLPSIYTNGLFDGFKDVLETGKLTSFMSVISFAEKKINEPSFIKEPVDGKKSKRGMIYRLIEYITAIATKDKPEKIEQVNTILRLLIILLENPDYQDDNDEISNGYINHSLNSISGRLHIALFDVCLMYARKFATPEMTVKWPDLAKEYFTKHLLRSGNTAKDYSIMVGSRLSVLLYLDNEWVLQNIDQIFNVKDEQQFEYTFGSSLSSLYQFDKTLYKVFKENKFYELALDRYTENDGRLTHVMNYGILEFQAWGISTDDPNAIINLVLKKKIIGQLLELIEVMDRNKFMDSKLIKTIWRKILDASPTDSGFDDVLAYVLSLINHAKELDEDTFNLIIETISKITNQSRINNFYYRKFYTIADTNLEKAADILILLFEKRLIMPYFENELQDFVRKLFKIDLNEKANRLCLIVSETNSFALKDVYDEFNKL